MSQYSASRSQRLAAASPRITSSTYVVAPPAIFVRDLVRAQKRRHLAQRLRCARSRAAASIRLPAIGRSRISLRSSWFRSAQKPCRRIASRARAVRLRSRRAFAAPWSGCLRPPRRSPHSVAPSARFSNSSARLPANTGCVCASTNPGITTRPPASTTSRRGHRRVRFQRACRHSRCAHRAISIAPSAMMPSSRISAPTRGRAGPASVTSCEQPTTASLAHCVGIHRHADALLVRHVDRLSISGVGVADHAHSRIGGQHALQAPRRTPRFHPPPPPSRHVARSRCRRRRRCGWRPTTRPPPCSPAR